jgi:Spy/CpxP family protein refolding chaperone
MKNLILTFAVAIGLSASAFSPVKTSSDLDITGIDLSDLEQAFNLDQTADEEKEKAGHCKELKLTDAQKQSIKTALIAHKKANIQTEAELKTARLDYFVALMEVPGAKGTAETAATAVSTAVGKFVNGHLAFANQIFFEILTPEQRKPGLACAHQYKVAAHAAKIKKLCEKKP